MQRIRRYFINTLIVCYLAIIYFAGVPESNTFNFRLKEKAQYTAMLIGIWPSWSMFAPNPIKFDTKSYVEVVYQDGTLEVHDVEIELKGVLAPFRKARWMKYSQDNLRSPKQRGLLTPAIRHFTAKYDSPERPVKSVSITRKWWDVKPFHEKKISPLLKSRIEKENTEILLTQNIEN